MERIDDTTNTKPKITRGKLPGDAVTTIFLSTIVFIPQITIKILVATIIRICFGIMKKSVVFIRKKTGSKKSVKKVITLDTISR